MMEKSIVRYFSGLSLFILAIGCSSVKKETSENGQHSSPFLSHSHNTKSNKNKSYQDSLNIQDAKSRHLSYSFLGTPPEKHDDGATKKLFYLYGAEHLNLKNTLFDIPVTFKRPVQRWIHFFQTRGREYFKKYVSRAGKYGPLLTKILRDQGLPQDLIYLAMGESGLQNHAVSHARAVGTWQFMPYTARIFGLNLNFYIDERRDLIKATIAAGRYLKKLYKDFDNWELSVSAYNAGEGKIRNAIRRYNTKNFWKMRKFRYLKRETKEYVPKIMALAIMSKNLEAFGFNDIMLMPPIDYEEIQVNGKTDLFELAYTLEVPFEELQQLNPELLRWVTPPSQSFYSLKVPVGVKQKWNECCAQKDYTATAFQKYTLKGRSSLAAVAHKFSLRPNVLEDLNDLSSKHMLSPGKEVVLPFRVGQNRNESMYRDLYYRKNKSSNGRMRMLNRIALARKRGTKIQNPTEYYVVKKGDTLWGVSRNTGVSLDTIIRSNLTLVSVREIRAGDRLVLR